MLGHFCSQRRACRRSAPRSRAASICGADPECGTTRPARARARTTLSRRFFLRQFCSRGPRRRPAPPGRAKAAPIRRIADPRQSRCHRECGLLHRSMSASTPRTPQSAPQRLFRSSAAARREPSGFQAPDVSIVSTSGAFPCVLSREFPRASRVPCFSAPPCSRRAAWPVPRRLPASLRRLPPSQWRRLSARVLRRHRRIARRSRTAPTR